MFMGFPFRGEWRWFILLSQVVRGQVRWSELPGKIDSWQHSFQVRLAKEVFGSPARGS
jgi:hypothetical protein